MRKMSLLLLQASMPLASRTLPKRLPLASPLALIHLHTKTTTTIAFSSKNSPVSSSSSMSHFTHSLTLPIQPHLPVQITAAPGVSDSEFRRAKISPLSSVCCFALLGFIDTENFVGLLKDCYWVLVVQQVVEQLAE
ncbi:Nudix hydrolase 14 chloroplastic -like protein [Tripterygium wilfordii]|uniref:Nudix hydrolase 14 chloroplastic -like protein n=1 Tax=Tripterygium wilfordii TaxID=458696 RepID=A0A7J7CK66_TRIWF|nr:Nudix hydrolase 14 chloroplastic -like protein [Tripterygium wilfordii]